MKCFAVPRHFRDTKLDASNIGLFDVAGMGDALTSWTVNADWRRLIAYALSHLDELPLWDGTDAELDVDLSEVTRLIDALYGDVPVSAPTGSILWQAHNELPSGYLPCDGQAYQEAAFPALFAKIGHTYGNPAAGFFQVPDYGGFVVVGEDAANGFPLADTGGESEHTLTVAELPAHEHTTPGRAQADAGAGSRIFAVNSGVSQVTTSSVGSDQPHNNMQPYIVQFAFIKT